MLYPVLALACAFAWYLIWSGRGVLAEYAVRNGKEDIFAIVLAPILLAALLLAYAAGVIRFCNRKDLIVRLTKEFFLEKRY